MKKKTFHEITGMTEQEWLVKRSKELLDSLDHKLVTDMEVSESDTEICIKVKYKTIPPILG